MTSPGGGNSVARGGYSRPASGQTVIIGGDYAVATGAPSIGGLRLYPIWSPFAQRMAQHGFNVTGAGAAGSTLVPCLYDCGPNGDPVNLKWSGAAVPADVIALALVASDLVIPAGYSWLGSLALIGTPTVNTVSRADHDPRGPYVPTNNLTGSVFPFQSGLGAPPAVYAGTYIAGSSPILFGVPA